MSKSAPIHQLLQQKVSRREFLTIAGFGLLSLLGLSSIIHFLTGKHSSLAKSSGYGNSPYGQ